MSIRVTLPPEVLAALDAIAERRGLTRRQAVVRAIGTLCACEAAAADGLCIGAADREALERVIVGPGSEAK